MRTRTLISSVYFLIIPIILCEFLAELGRLGDGGYRLLPHLMTQASAILVLIQINIIAIVVTRRILDKSFFITDFFLLMPFALSFFMIFRAVFMFIMVIKEMAKLNVGYVLRTQGGTYFIIFYVLLLISSPFLTIYCKNIYLNGKNKAE